MVNRFLKSKDFEIFKYILTIFVGWRVAITFIAFLGISFLPIRLSPTDLGWVNPDTEFWVKWANWDGGHFRGIAENGYSHSFQVVFFPLLPVLIKSLMLNGIPSLWGGLIISSISLLGALFYLYKLASLDYPESTVKKVLLLTLAFPTSFYFGAVYSESLFLFLTVSAFYFSRKEKWFLAFLLAGLSTITRLSGLIVIFAITLEYFSNKPELKLIGLYRYHLMNWINLKRIFTLPVLFILISVLPLLAYCSYLASTQGDPFAFISHEKQWHRALTYPWIAPIEYFRRLWGVKFFELGLSAQALVEFLFFAIFSLLLLISIIKLRISYTVFFALSLLVPISSGTLQSIHRYGLVIFPVFLILALIKSDTYYHLWLFFSLTLLGFFTVLFINGYWVT